MIKAKFGGGLLPQQANIRILYSLKHEKRFCNVFHMYGKVRMV